MLSVVVQLPIYTIMRFSWQVYWGGLPFPPLVNHVLPELSTMTLPSWVVLHGIAHSFMINLWVVTIIPISQRSDLPKVTQLVLEEQSVTALLVSFQYHSLFFTNMPGKLPSSSSSFLCPEQSANSVTSFWVFAQILPFSYNSISL